MWKIFGIIAIVAAVLAVVNKLFTSFKFKNATKKIENDVTTSAENASTKLKATDATVVATANTVDAAIKKTDDIKTAVNNDAKTSEEVQKAKASAAGFTTKEN